MVRYSDRILKEIPEIKKLIFEKIKNEEKFKLNNEYYARKCTECNKGMNKGYFDDGNYFCDDDCLNINYTPEQWKQEVKNNPDKCYWTEWNEIDEDEYYDKKGKLYSNK